MNEICMYNDNNNIMLKLKKALQINIVVNDRYNTRLGGSNTV